jgi:hypothetical protein
MSGCELTLVVLLQEFCVSIDLTRIAIGKKVFKESCRAVFSCTKKELALSYATASVGSPQRTRSSPKKELVSIKFDLGSEEIEEVKYFRRGSETPIGEEQRIGSFIALQILKSESNGLLQYPNAYDPRFDAPKEKRFVVLEFPGDNDQFDRLLAILQNELPHFVNDLSQLLVIDEAFGYCEALCADNEKDTKYIWRPNDRQKPRKSDDDDDDEDTLLPANSLIGRVGGHCRTDAAGL